MKTNRSALVRAAIMIAIIALASIILVGSFAAANSPWGRPEIWDIDVLHQRDPAQTEETSSIFGTRGLPLTPHFDIKPVMAFDPWAGDLVDPNFIPPATADSGSQFTYTIQKLNF